MDIHDSCGQHAVGREDIKFILLAYILLSSHVIQDNLSVKETIQVLSATTLLREKGCSPLAFWKRG